MVKALYNLRLSGESFEDSFCCPEKNAHGLKQSSVCADEICRRNKNNVGRRMKSFMTSAFFTRAGITGGAGRSLCNSVLFQ